MELGALERFLGAERRRIEADPDLVPSRGVILYALHADPEFIVPGETLEIRNLADDDGRRRPLEIVLWVRNQPAGGEE